MIALFVLALTASPQPVDTETDRTWGKTPGAAAQSIHTAHGEGDFVSSSVRLVYAPMRTRSKSTSAR